MPQDVLAEADGCDPQREGLCAHGGGLGESLERVAGCIWLLNDR